MTIFVTHATKIDNLYSIPPDHPPLFVKKEMHDTVEWESWGKRKIILHPDGFTLLRTPAKSSQGH
jgi:hypothetical protein